MNSYHYLIEGVDGDGRYWGRRGVVENIAGIADAARAAVSMAFASMDDHTFCNGPYKINKLELIRVMLYDDPEPSIR